MTSRSDPVADELFATLSPTFVNSSDILQTLTYRELIALFYVLALAEKQQRRRIPAPTRYELLRLFTSGGTNSGDYEKLALFITETAPGLGIWDVVEGRNGGNYIRFRRRFWQQNYRAFDEGSVEAWVKADISLLLKLRTRTEVLLALVVEAWANKPGKRWKTILEDLARLVGLSDLNRSRSRNTIENTFKAVRKAYGKTGKGLGIEFEIVRHSRFSATAVTISHSSAGKKGRMRSTRLSASDFESRLERVEQRQDASANRHVRQEVDDLLDRYRGRPGGMTMLARDWSKIANKGSYKGRILRAKLTTTEFQQVQDCWNEGKENSALRE